jgi:DNA-binding transcriptional ArsR family regulator
MRENPCTTFFDLLSTRSRLDILMALKDGEKSVGEICDSVNVERTNVSHQLKILRDCGFVFVRREGKKKIYSLNTETVKPLIDLSQKHMEKYCRLRRGEHTCKP